MWIVKLIERPVVFTWKDDYFPRMFIYKKEAQQCVESVEDSNGKAVLLKEPKITAKQEGGDDGHCYCVRVNGKLYESGLTRGEIPYAKSQAMKMWMEKSHEWI